MRRARFSLGLGLVAALALLLAFPVSALAIKVGQKIKSFRLKDAKGKVYTNRSFKKKVLMIWYEGAKSKEQNRWLKKLLKRIYDGNKIPQALWESVGIANFQEHWASNWIIRQVIKAEQKETGAVILCDEKGALRGTWGFRNGRSNIYLFDKNRVLRWKTSGPLNKRRGKQLIRLLRRLTRE